MGVAREGVKAAFLLPILLLHLSCGQVVDGQRRDLQRVNPARLTQLLLFAGDPPAAQLTKVSSFPQASRTPGDNTDIKSPLFLTIK